MSELDDEIRAMLLERSAHADASGIREQAVAAARSTPQLHPLARPGFTRPALRLAGGLTGLAVVVLAVIIAVAVLSPPSRGPGGGLVGGPSSPATSAAASSAAASSASSPSPTDVPVTPPPYVAGSCPVTPITDMAGGTAPEVVVSGVRWRWGGIPWRAGLYQKVVVLPVAAGASVAADEVLAERLPIGPTVAPMSVVYPIGSSGAFGIGLPEPGCWLLTLVGPTVHSSVVVDAAAAPPNPPDPVSQNVPTVTRPLVPSPTCPVSPRDPSATVRTWLDGNVSWQDPDPSAWLPGTARKLVVSGTGDNQPLERLVATPVGTVAATRAFVGSSLAVATPVPGGGSKASMLTLPRAGCWAITYVDPTMTSTVVVDIAP